MGDTIAGKEHNMENATATTTTPNFPKDPIHDPAVPMATRRLLAGRRHMCTDLSCPFDFQFGEAVKAKAIAGDADAHKREITIRVVGGDPVPSGELEAAIEAGTVPTPAAHDCEAEPVPYVSDGALGHGFECGMCGKFIQAG